MCLKKISKSVLFFALVVIALTGCSPQTDGKKILRSGSETTVVIESTDSITPEKGAVYGVKRIQNYIAYDFLDNNTTIGYKFSEDIFGDDRGVYVWNMNEAIPYYKLAFERQPKELKISPDKTRLLYVPDQTGGSNTFTVLNIEKWRDSAEAKPSESTNPAEGQAAKQSLTATFLQQEYKLPRADYLWAFNWLDAHEGSVIIPLANNEYRLYSLDEQGRFATETFTLKSKPDEFSYVLEQSLVKADQAYIVAVSGKRGGLYSLKGQILSPISSEFQISQMSGSPKGNTIALSSFETDKPGQELWLFGPNGQKQTSLYKANYFTSLQWSADGQKLAFSAIESDGRAALYLADLKTNQLNFLGDYPGYGPNTIAFSPNNKQLLISYLNNESAESDEPVWETQILTIEKDGGSYNE